MISSIFIKRPILAMVIAIMTLLGGVIAMLGLPMAQFPDIVPPQVAVTATYTGADAITIEQSVSAPLEQQMNGVDNMLYMLSTNASDGTEQLSVTFDVGTDVNMNQVNVQNRIAQAQPNLPTDVVQYGLTTRKSTSLPLLLISLSSPKRTHDALFLANYATINIIDALYRVNGVGEVRVFGAGEYAMRAWVKPDALSRLGLAVPDIANAVRQQSNVNPSGKVGAEPSPPGVEKTYTVRSQEGCRRPSSSALSSSARRTMVPSCGSRTSHGSNSGPSTIKPCRARMANPPPISQSFKPRAQMRWLLPTALDG